MSNDVSNKKLRAQNPDTTATDTAASGLSANGSSGVKNGSGAVGDVPRFVAPTHGGVDILKLLTELEDQVEGTRKGPFGSMIGFDEDKFHMTIMKIRANLPEEMKRASKLAREAERIVEETRTDSERIKEDARRMALQDVERGKKEAAAEREQARMDAEQHLADAKSEASRLHGDANGALDRAREAAEREARQILDEAQTHGREIIAEARAQAAQLVEDNEIVQQAQIVAQDAQMRAQAEAQAVRRGADEYARDVLTNLENVLGKATMQIQRGRETLDRG